jgi:acetyl-CoA carboxylase biotin carboxyl carrier protein
VATDSKKNDKPHPFDVQTVEHLIGLMAKHELSEIALNDGDQRIRLRKGGQPVAYAAAPTPIAAVPGPAPAGVPAAPAAPAKKLHDVKSVMVGVYYSRPKPDKDDFLKVGQTVKPDTTVALIEAMKIFNEIKAECSGVVEEICVKNGDEVQYGTVLFRVDPS